MLLIKNNILMFIAGLGIISAIIFATVVFSPSKDLKLIFLDVEQGDATLIITPMGKQILIDTGAKQAISQKWHTLSACTS